jgi:hypothetical protein
MGLNYSSLSFNGTTHYVKLPAANSIRNLGAFAFGAWFKVGANSVRPDQHAYVERQGTGTGIRFRFTPIKDKLQFGFSPKDGVTDTSYTYNTKWDDRWHFAMFTARLGGDNPTYEIFLDGVRVADGTLVVPSGVTAISDTAAKGIYMGNHSRLASGESFPTSTAWHGKLDEVVVFNESSGQGDATAYFASDDQWELDHTETNPMLAYYPMDENSGSLLNDISVETVRQATIYNGTGIWTIDRPFLGDGLTDTTPPSTPTTNAHTNLTADGFDVTWNASTDNVWVQFYELQVAPFADFSTYSAYDTGTKLNAQVRGLLPATNYYWRVRAVDAELNVSAYSTVRSLTTPSLGDVAPPMPPTNLTASFVSHASFRVSFTQSISGDAVGYKIDISDSADFATFVDGYRNTDIGNVSFIDVFGVNALTSYYVRVRTYDAFDNESNDSVVLRVNTTRAPDTTPPLVVTLHEPTSVSSTAAIINWDEGVDDTGVVGYYVDISTSEIFAGYVTANNIFWQSVDVGNVTEFRVTGLSGDTNYYYRVRAYDDAGNVGPDQSEPMMITTAPASVYEGGLLDTQELVEEWRSGVNDGAAILEVNGGSTVKLVFDLSTTVGTFERVVLTFLPRPSASPTTLGNIRVKAALGDLTTVVGGSGLVYNITQLDEPVEIDITSLFGAGPAQYVVELSSEGFIGFIDSGTPVEVFNDGDTFRPYLALTSDPLSSTQPLPLDVEVLSYERENVWMNPSFETSTTGWVAAASASLTRTLGGTDGLYCLQVAGSLANSGATTGSAAGQRVDASAGQSYVFSFDARSVSGNKSFTTYAEGFTSSNVSVAQYGNTPITLSTRWNRYAIAVTIPAGATTVAHLRFRVYTAVAAAYTMQIDNVLIERTTLVGSPFNGNTANAWWTGTANESPSKMAVATLQVDSAYVGDSNDNNSLAAFVRHEQDEAWVPLPAPVVDRVLRRYQVTVPPSMPQHNLIPNPSFEVDSGWTGGTYTTDVAYEGSRSYSTSGYGVSGFLPILPSTEYTVQMRLQTEDGVAAVPYVSFFTSADVLISNLKGTDFDPDVLAYSAVQWELVSFTFTTPATAAFIQVGFLSGLASTGIGIAGTSWADNVQLNLGALRPYRDGTYVDAMWEGTSHTSSTAMMLAPDQVYDFRFDYTDPEGFFDDGTETTYSLLDSYTVPSAPDNVTTVTALDLLPYDNNIDVVLRYAGDDNENAVVRFEFRRTDLSTWSEFRPIYDHANKQVRGTINNLKYGTSYTVRAYVTDVDGAYGVSNGFITSITTTGYIDAAVDAEPHISFGGFVLMGRQDRKIGVIEHDAFGFPKRRVELEPLPRLDGAVEMQALWDNKDITMRGFISGDSRSDLKDVRDALLRGLAPRQQRLVIDTLASSGRFYYATVDALRIDEAADENITHLNWTASFVCADPFAYDISETSLPTFEAPNGGTIALTNDGDVQAFPTLTVTTQSAYPVTFVISNETTGERIAPKTTILMGDRFTIDSERRSLQKNGIEIDYAGSFPTLALGGNTLSFIVAAASGAPTLAVDIRWRNKFL